jgi:hypothetical protein
MPTLALNRSCYEPKEIVMNPIRHIRRMTAALAGLAGALLAFAAAPAAFALPVPPSGGSGVTSPPQPPVQIHTVVMGGMPGWQVALIAIGAALFTAAAAVVLDRAWTTRRRSATAAA